ncbi:MAG: class I SAM-dependent methyltransferase [Pseudomonadota bacterium]
MIRDAIQHYCRRGRLDIDGWFPRLDAHLFALILEAQEKDGLGVVEIGVHHGKSFVPLALSNDAQRCYAVDVFDRQDQNTDRSGKGDLAKFSESLMRVGIDPADIVIDKRRSDQVAPADILDSVGPVRFFHIDGGHHAEAVQDDLALADATLHESGVVAVDDAFRPDWPEVDRGMFAALADDALDLHAFAFGHNKLYLCRKAWLTRYRTLLADDPFLSIFFARLYTGRYTSLMIFRRLFDATASFRAMAVAFLLERYPDLVFAMMARFTPNALERRHLRRQLPKHLFMPKPETAGLSVAASKPEEKRGRKAA